MVGRTQTSRSHALGRLALVAVMVSASAGSAAAAPGLVVVGGSAPPDQRATASAALATATAESGWTAPAASPSKAETAALLGCSDTTTPWSCIPASLHDVHNVLVVTLDSKPGDDGTAVLVLVGKLITTSPESSIVRQRFCEHCTDDRLRNESTELAREVIRDLAVRNGRTVLAIRSEPPGAAITLDGTRIGATNASYNTYPGAHVIVIEKPGFVSETRQVTAEDGKASEIAVTLRASETTAPAIPSPSHSHLVPALVLGGGVAALGIGIALQLAKDSPPLGEPQPARLYSAPGIGLAIGGTALVALGTYLWIRASHRDSAAPASAGPAITAVDGGGMIGWSQAY